MAIFAGLESVGNLMVKKRVTPITNMVMPILFSQLPPSFCSKSALISRGEACANFGGGVSGGALGRTGGMGGGVGGWDPGGPGAGGRWAGRGGGRAVGRGWEVARGVV